MSNQETKLGLLLKYVFACAIAVVIILTQNIIQTEANVHFADKKYQYEQELIQKGEVPKGYVKLNCGRIVKGETAPEEYKDLDPLPEGYMRTTCGTVIKAPQQ